MAERSPPGDAITVIVLTYNAAPSIARTIRSARRLSADIRVVDSFSTDDTVARCEALGCEVVSHAFSTYAEQRNWAIARFATAAWQLHFDADEELTPALVTAIRALDLAATPHAGKLSQPDEFQCTDDGGARDGPTARRRQTSLGA